MLVLARAVGSPSAPRQRELLSNADESVSERDLEVEYLTGDAPETGEARQMYGGAEYEFAVLLIGLGGSVKLRSGVSVAPGRIFGRIDGMPVRRRKMRKAEERGRD